MNWLIAIIIGGVLVSPVSVAQKPPIEIDTSAMQPDAEPADFTFSRTGQGADGKWTVVADPMSARGRAIEASQVKFIRG
jgi:hypothetical protein